MLMFYWLNDATIMEISVCFSWAFGTFNNINWYVSKELQYRATTNNCAQSLCLTDSLGMTYNLSMSAFKSLKQIT